LLISLSPREAIPVSSKDDLVAEMAQDIVQRMDPIGNHQGRADTKRRQAAALLKRVFKDMLHRAADA
jgi:carbon-monoxide dehydrogenase medium subunit